MIPFRKKSGREPPVIPSGAEKHLGFIGLLFLVVICGGLDGEDLQRITVKEAKETIQLLSVNPVQYKRMKLQLSNISSDGGSPGMLRYKEARSWKEVGCRSMVDNRAELTEETGVLGFKTLECQWTVQPPQKITPTVKAAIPALDSENVYYSMREEAKDVSQLMAFDKQKLTQYILYMLFKGQYGGDFLNVSYRNKTGSAWIAIHEEQKDVALGNFWNSDGTVGQEIRIQRLGGRPFDLEILKKEMPFYVLQNEK